MKCKELKEYKNATDTVLRNGRKASTAQCITCGTKMYKMKGGDKK